MFRLSEILGFQFEIDQNEFSSRSEVTLNIIDGKIIDNYQIDQKNIFTFSEAEINYFYNVNYGKDAITIEINKKEISHIYDFWVKYFSFHLERKFSLKSAGLFI